MDNYTEPNLASATKIGAGPVFGNSRQIMSPKYPKVIFFNLNLGN